MLRQTMEKIQRNTSPLPRRIHSSIAPPNPQIRQNSSRNNLRTQYNNSSSSSNLHQFNHHQYTIDSYERSRLITNHSSDRKPSPQHGHINIPQLRDTLTQDSRSILPLPKTLNQQILSPSIPKQSNFLQTYRSQTQRPLLTMRNNQSLSYQQRILKLQQQLSDSFTDKLALQLKLSKSIQKSTQLQLKLSELKNQFQYQLSTKQRNNHSITLQSHMETITKLLLEYDQTKSIIQKLMEDNEMLIKKNEELMGYEGKWRRGSHELEKFKIIVGKVENEKMGLLEQVDRLGLDLDYERNSKYALLKRAEGKNKEELESSEGWKESIRMKEEEIWRKEGEVRRKEEEVEALKKYLAGVNNAKIILEGNVQEKNRKIEEMRISNEEMMIILCQKDSQILSLSSLKRQNQDLLLILSQKQQIILQLTSTTSSLSQQTKLQLSSKDSEILHLNLQLQQMSFKLKQMLKQLANFSQAFQNEKHEKMQILEFYSNYKSQSELRINRLMEEIQIMKKGSRLKESPKVYKSDLDPTLYSNTIFIEPTDLKETKTRITGGYEEVILGQKPPVPVVTKVRTIADDQMYNGIGYQ